MLRRARRWLIALSVISLAACGGARHDQMTVGSAARPPQASSAYRWLVPTSGSQPTVAAENLASGTRAWRLPGPAADVGGLRSGDVSGYVAEEALGPGQTERIYVSAPGSPSVRIGIYRIGWYGGAGGRQVLVTSSLPLVPQPPCSHRFATGLTQCDWHPTLSFRIPSALPTGIYIAKLSARSGESDCLFVVLAAAPQPLLAQLPTSTYEAYNAWGGDSLYPGGTDRVAITGTTQGIAVSYDRPYDSVTGAGQFFARDVAMVWFLERYGYPVSYTTSESVDGNPGQLLGHRAIIDFGHSEYWSERQARGFAAALRAGTDLLFLGSDTMAWRVRYVRASAAASQAGEPDHSIVAYKEHAALDPDHTNPTGPFPKGGAPLTGSSYLGCIDPRLRGKGPPRYRYYPWRPARGLKPAWLFAGTGITAATRIPGIVGYEVDMRTAATPEGAHLVGSGAVRCMGAEVGEPAPGPGQNLAETTIYRAPSRAIVFNTGTLGWELGLEPVPSASPNTPKAPDRWVVAMTRNLLAHVLGSPG
ncbi:MAG TPA: N,N-dimethylformamidase beta subunit family domain-containing protein [Solirubrobacteraceae bacterium]|nr:N,N-dimethylformamidase beta subunit family domain-containing protein [Solirubrobacteraceae bacterium]